MGEIMIPRFGVEKLDRLRRELLGELRRFGYEVMDTGELLFTGAKLAVGGVFHTRIARHEWMDRALETGDPARIAWANRAIRAAGDHLTGRRYFDVATEGAGNKIPDAALTNLLGVWLGGTAKKNAWYLAPFSSDSVPSAAWASDWAKAGGVATEFTDYDETGRQIWAADAAADKSIGNSTRTELTVSAGIVDASIYGMTLNSVATQGYDQTDQVLAAATRYATAKVVNATDIADVAYYLAASSTT